jgi:hypothetical protein
VSTEHDNGYDPYNSAATRKAPPIPDWLRNDPELEAIAVAICSRLPRWQSFGVDTGSWALGRGAGKTTLARYRK